MGIQLAVGLILAIVTRANYMVVGALQFITNPFTAFPIYGGTFWLGRRILRSVGFPVRGARLPEGWGEMKVGEIIGHLEMGTAIGQGVICLIVGGIVAGLILGAMLDGVHYLGVRTTMTSAPAPEKKFDPNTPPPVP